MGRAPAGISNALVRAITFGSKLELTSVLGNSRDSLRIKADHFAHVLLFSCPECERPLASACASGKQNLEEADAHFFNPHCPCGWTGAVAGMEDVKHWVEPWRTFRVEIGAAGPSDGTCDGRAH